MVPTTKELVFETHAASGKLVPWKDGVLATDGDTHIEFWTSGGSAKLPMAAQGHGTVATGPLGLVSIGDGQVLVSRDGIDYKVSSIPAQMADPANGGRGWTVVAVGDRSVVVLESELGRPRLFGSARSNRDRPDAGPRDGGGALPMSLHASPIRPEPSTDTFVEQRET